MLPRRIKQVPRNRLREIAVGLLDKTAILEVEHVAMERQLIRVSGFAEQVSRLADQVEREVGEADVDLKHRPMPAPFAKPLSEHERIVAEPQQIFEARGIRVVR